MNHLLILIFIFYSCRALIEPLTNDNYVKRVKNATRTQDMMVACFDEARQRELIVGFLIMFDDVVAVRKNRSSFAYCNAPEATQFMQDVKLRSVPAVVVIHKGMAYHLYGSKSIMNKNTLIKFSSEFMSMSARVTRLPAYLLPKGIKIEFPQKRKPWESIVSVSFYKYLQDLIADFTGQSWEKNIIYLGIMFLLPVMFGLILMLIGYCAERKREPIRIPDNKKAK
eukprot:TRINITY_DN2094_c0_g5_i4.p1 TRINITY_DN2094_c0_g5~~TRINITY_DN2094_c0_g5_i4.p1  ORF type:complete len:225 (+),score=57.96 TRINITY_DN2094_c0_g5_i4:124-798(+)